MGQCLRGEMRGIFKTVADTILGGKQVPFLTQNKLFKEISVKYKHAQKFKFIAGENKLKKIRRDFSGQRGLCRGSPCPGGERARRGPGPQGTRHRQRNSPDDFKGRIMGDPRPPLGRKENTNNGIPGIFNIQPKPWGPNIPKYLSQRMVKVNEWVFFMVNCEPSPPPQLSSPLAQ